MDSFSELTDQQFYYRKEQWSFYANYSDINHSPEFKSKFDSLGLLEEDILKEQYNKYFSFFRNKYEDVPIIFLHFPAKLDKREKFKIRYTKIKEAIDEIKINYLHFYSFEVDEDIVDWPDEKTSELETFPYHFNKATYENLAEQVKKSGVFKIKTK